MSIGTQGSQARSSASFSPTPRVTASAVKLSAFGAGSTVSVMDAWAPL